MLEYAQCSLTPGHNQWPVASGSTHNLRTFLQCIFLSRKQCLCIFKRKSKLYHRLELVSGMSKNHKLRQEITFVCGIGCSGRAEYSIAC